MRLSNVSLNNLVNLKGNYRSGTFNEIAMAKVIKAFKLKPDCHCTSKYLNNLIEQDHRHIKVRKARCQSINTAKNTLKGIECIYALYKKNRRSLQIYGFSPCQEISIMLAS